MPGLKTLARATLDKTSLGNLMVKEGIIGSDELIELLSEFRSSDAGGYFGQFLLERGVLSREKLEFVLLRQAAARDGGIQRQHVDRAKEIAAKTSVKLSIEMDNFMDGLNRSLAEKSVSSDTGS